jgi:hypothetical protein
MGENHLYILQGAVVSDFVESDFSTLIRDLKQFRIFIEICQDIRLLRSFHTVVHFGKLVMYYGPLWQIWFCARRQRSKCGYVLWTTMRNEAVLYKSVMISSPRVKVNYLIIRHGLVWL